MTAVNKIYKHITYNHAMQGLGWALEQVDDGYKLIHVVPYTAYESVAVFEKELESKKEESDDV